MKLKDVYNLIEGVALVSISNEVKYANYGLREPPEDVMEKEVKDIEPFYSSSGLYKYGVVIHIKEN